MRVPDHVKKIVVFLGIMEDERFVPKATGFLVLTYLAREDTPRPLPKMVKRNPFSLEVLPSGEEKELPWSPIGFPFLVTAEHVVVALQATGAEIYCRMNLREGGVAIESLANASWLTHPDPSQLTDVAATAFWVNVDVVDHMYLPFGLARDEWIRRRKAIGMSPVAIGADVFVVGLFKNHHGRERNIPIMRIGNVAALPEEPVRTLYAGEIEAYLIELRSIAGLSGSPVFIHPQWERTTSSVYDEKFDDFIFMGLVHGHFDIPDLRHDSVMDDAAGSSGINTGIGVVIPSRLILETIQQPSSVSQMVDKLREYLRTGATPDLGVVVLPTDTSGMPLGSLYKDT